MVIRVHCANYQFFMPDYQHNFFKATPHSTSMPSSEVSQLKHAQGAIHICKPVFRCYEIGKYTKKIAKFFQKCKTCVSSFLRNYARRKMATMCKMRKSDDARCKISTSACKANLGRVVRPPKLRISTETETVQNAKC